MLLPVAFKLPRPHRGEENQFPLYGVLRYLRAVSARVVLGPESMAHL
jgi:hypothetical protein